MTDETVKTIWWNDDHNSIMLIDQTKLPVEFVVLEITTVERLAEAISRLEVLVAPAFGVAGAFGVALSALSCTTTDVEFAKTVAADAALLKSTQSTAVNLAWGIDKVLRAMEKLPPEAAKNMHAARPQRSNASPAFRHRSHPLQRRSARLHHVGDCSRGNPCSLQNGQKDLRHLL